SSRSARAIAGVMSKVVAGAGSCTGSGPRVSAGLPRSSRVRRALRRCRPIILLLSRDFNLGVSMRYSAPKTAARYNPARSRQGTRGGDENVPADIKRPLQTHSRETAAKLLISVALLPEQPASVRCHSFQASAHGLPAARGFGSPHSARSLLGYTQSKQPTRL